MVTVLALLSIQCYFISNTYQLKEREIKFQVKTILEKLDDRQDFEKTDFKDDREQALLIDFQNFKINEKQLIASLQKIETKHYEIAMQYINKIFKKTNFDVGYSKSITSIIVIKNGKKDTLLNKNIVLYKSKMPLENKMLLTSSSWHTSSEQSSSTDKKSETNKKYEYEVKKNYSYSINNLQSLIFTEMIGLLIISFLLMVFVIALFYYSIKNLINQKKIAETQRDFINNITHEFKTPLATLSIATKTLNNHFLEKDTMQNTVAVIERQNNRLQKIFNQVNFNSILTNVENAKIDQNIDNKFLENCINDFQIANPENTILSSIDSNINLQMSKFHFNTILTNLLENAIKYGGTKLEISAKSNDKIFILKIKDNGIGIEKKEQKLIFDKFYRIGNGDIHSTKGLGLGLFYTKEIVEIYHGEITVDSNKNGSEFLISI